MAFRFEYYENIISKHHLNKIDWRQAGMWAFNNGLNSSNTTIARVR